MTLGLLHVSPALAQGGAAGPGRREVLGATVGVQAAGTGDMREANAAVANPTLDSRFAADFRGQINYVPFAGKRSLQISAQSGARRYQTGSEFMVLGHSVNAALASPFGRRTTVSATLGFSYVPSYSLVPSEFSLTSAGAALAGAAQAGVTPDSPFVLMPAAPIEATIARRVAHSTQASVTTSHQFSRRLSASALITGSLQDFAETEDPGVLSRSISASLRFRLNRFAWLRMGYGRHFGDYDLEAGVRRSVKDDIDFGIDYEYGRSGGSSLALTKSTSVLFNTGVSLGGTENSRIEAADTRSVTLIGSATLRQRLGRNGQLSLAYNRNVGFVGSFTEPVLGNSISASGQYQLGRRLMFAGSASPTANTVGLAGGEEGRYYTFNGSAQMIYAFHRQGQLVAQYSVASHAVDQGVELLTSVPRQQFRGSFQLGVNWRLPLMTVRSERN
jgi:hypothetical protein